MRIKKLEVFGFKSFADKTEFVFDEGITCIVGPNGCGKSNVVDAVKWILGEQSAKSLRGTEMSDVIFNGSAGRHPLGFAEATLVFDNSSRRLPVDLAEVAVTRRLYRSGESEYMINRKLCRLRDIREIFMDTGVGLNAYSLIEQGRVDVLLQSNPQQRRAVFEEAAGISKYKAKKKEALRKLERAEQNLLRLSDIIEEVQKRLRSVKYQAGKARNWQVYHDRLKELRIMHSLNEYHTLDQTRQRLAAEHAAGEDRRAELQGRITSAEARQSELEASLLRLDDELRQADARLVDLRGQIAAAESDIAFQHTRVEEWRQTQDRDRRRMGELDQRLAESDVQIAETSAEAARVEELLAALKARLAESEAALVQAQRDARQLAAQLDAEKSAVMDLVRQTSQVRNDLSSVDLRTENLKASRTRLEKRQAEIAEQLLRLTEQKSTIETGIADLDFAIQRDQQRLNVKRDEAKRLNDEAEQAATEQAAAKEFRSGLLSRRDLLADLESRGEGLEEGVRRVLQLAGQGLFPGIRGIVAELITVDHRYATLVEAALGEAEQSIVIDRRQDVLDSLEKLEETLEGRAGFLPLDSLQPARRAADLVGHAGVVARMADLVATDAALRPMVECLLGNTLLVEDLAVALRLSGGSLARYGRDGLAGVRYVTLSGETVEADGRMNLGRLTARAGLISRKSELRELDVQLADVEKRIAAGQTRSQDIARRLHELDEEQRELRSIIYDASTSRVDLVAQKRRLNEMAESLRGEEPVIASELSGLAAETAKLAERRTGLEARLAELDAESERRKQAIESLGRQLSAAEAERARLEEARTHQRVETAKVETERRGVEDRLSHLKTTRDEAARQRRDAAQELDACGQRIRDAERAVLRQESLIARLFLDKEAVGRRCRELSHQRQEGRRRAAEMHDEIRQVQAALREVEEAQHQINMQLSECRLKMETLEARVREDYQIELAERVRQYTPESVDWAAIEEEIGELRTKIERLGAVNLEAIKEQDELEQRNDFLVKQQKDLEEARRLLDRLIERINTESIARFKTTFEQVRENFIVLFRKLFGGGKADIVLLQPEDVLESGIEIVARPPGKEPCSISLLSGGEKTMTAVALLMAVFRSKPSPFCILDEVDAALDEANNERFNAVVREFVAESQFVIITHSKRTMAVGDILYGVTMQEPGVSKKISVRFADLHQLKLDEMNDAEETAETEPTQAAGA